MTKGESFTKFTYNPSILIIISSDDVHFFWFESSLKNYVHDILYRIKKDNGFCSLSYLYINYGKGIDTLLIFSDNLDCGIYWSFTLLSNYVHGTEIRPFYLIVCKVAKRRYLFEEIVKMWSGRNIRHMRMPLQLRKQLHLCIYLEGAVVEKDMKLIHDDTVVHVFTTKNTLQPFVAIVCADEFLTLMSIDVFLYLTFCNILIYTL